MFIRFLKEAITIATIFSLSFTFLFAQKGFSPTILSQTVITEWTGDNGLISNNITYALQARTGFIWITTYNGIMRFDGRKVDVYDRSVVPFFNTDSFYAVYEDANGTLWFASQGSGLIKYENEKFSAIDPEGKVLPKSIRCLLLDTNGVIWIGSNNNGLYKMKDNSIEHVDHPELNSAGILDLVKDPKGNLWIATDGNGLFQLSQDSIRSFTKESGLSSNTINAIQVDQQGALWVGTTVGLDVFSMGAFRKYEKLANAQINEITIDDANNKWIGCELGLARIRDKTDSFEFIGEREGYPLSRINCISFDRENSMWVSTGRNGLVQLKETNIMNITTAEGLGTNKINIITEGPNQTFYVGTDIGSIDVYQNGRITPYSIKTPFEGAGVRDIIVEDHQNLWVASYRGLLKIQNGKEKLFTTDHGLPALDVRRILKDRQGRVWIGTRSGGVAVMRNDKIEARYDKTNHLKSNYILAIEEDLQGNIYIGTHSGGLTKINTDGTIEHFSIQADDAGMLIFNIHIDDHHHIWIVTNIGPYFLKGKTFQKINLDKTIKGETYFDWIDDHQGSIWITTNIGILKMTRPEVEDFITGKIPSIKARLYDNQDGMKSKECTGATRSLVSNSGRIWIPTIGGICVLQPEKSKPNELLPPVYVTSLNVDNEEAPLDPSISIEPGKLRYRFDFTAPTFIAPGKIRFRYKLAPVDRDWINADQNRQAEYTNLLPGEYTFSVMTSNNDGVWNPTPTSISFYIKPFYYQTKWFYIIVGLLLISSLYGIYRWRINEVEKRNAELRKVNSELDRFVYSASHDLRAPLASILGLINVARLDKEGNLQDYLDKIEYSVNKLDGFVKDIIDFARNARIDIVPEPIAFEVLIHEIIDDLKYLDDKDQITRKVKVNGRGVFHTDRKRLSIVLSNLISNSIKYFNPHAEHPFLEVSVEHDESKAIVTVRDNGIGIAQEHVDNIFKMFYRGDTKSRGSGLGLYIVMETLQKIGGTIEVKSTYGEGSTFTFTLPNITPKAKGEEKLDFE